MNSKSLLLGLALGQALGLSALADDRPQWLGAKRAGVWRESGLLSEIPDGGPKVTGAARYGADYAPPGLLRGKVLRAPHAHARITALDSSKARALPGVHAVVTGADFPDFPE